jgi:hypothetical protein
MKIRNWSGKDWRRSPSEAPPGGAALLRHWDEQPHVIASDPNDDWQWETELGKSPGWREQLIAQLDGRPIGFVQIIDPACEESHYWGEVPHGLRAIDIWIGEGGLLVTFDWHILGEQNRLIRQWRQSYQLVRVARKWQVLTSMFHAE